MAYVVWRVLMKQYSKVRLGIQKNPAVDDEVSPNTRRTKSFDDQTWKVHDETANLSANISAISTTALASRSCRLVTDLGPAGLDEVLVMSASSEPSSTGDACDSLSRGEVRKSRSKMKNYLKRCKDVLIGGVSVSATEDASSSATGTPESAERPPLHSESVVYHAAGSSQPNSCWYLEDHLIELRPEDNREPYSSLASARLKLETEEARQRDAASCSSSSSSNIPSSVTITTCVTSTASSTTAPIGHHSVAFDAVPQDDQRQSVSERIAIGDDGEGASTMM
ncbi:uncharacterized protein LOC125955747 [Anopheles darlingi]|uniref:uncharacterized protein LOC125955747 n=1 Tax=Anopheles darlingi TaxID=43151 RepID=UPI0021006271|nr:uncharacterized protein LOC125955747 [Anopheles darlingi]